MKTEYKIVPSNKVFRFKSLCPYCKADLTYEADSWEQDEDGLWMAVSFDMDCLLMPDMDNEIEWDEWFSQHSDMPYVNQYPVDQNVKDFINRKYRFDLDK